MKILVTGCFGFIGFNFLNFLLSKQSGIEEIIGIDKLENTYSLKNKDLTIQKDNFKFIQEDIVNINELEDDIKDVDAVFNFAAETHVDNSIFNPEEFINSNILGTAKLLRFGMENEIENFFHISTDEVYGSSTDLYNIESDILNPSSPYSASKASAEMICNSYSKTYGYDVCIIRPANNYGVFQQPEKLIPFSLCKLFSGDNIEIYGDGKNVRHWLNVDDTVEGIFHLYINKINNGIYNIGSGEYMENIELAKKILEALGLNEDRLSFVKDRPGHDFRYAININKITSTGWKPNRKIDKELEKIIKWYKDNENWWKEGMNQIDENRKKRFNIT